MKKIKNGSPLFTKVLSKIIVIEVHFKYVFFVFYQIAIFIEKQHMPLKWDIIPLAVM